MTDAAPEYPEELLQRVHARALAQERALLDPRRLTLESLVTHEKLGGLAASRVQLALMRAADGRPLDGILTREECERHFGCAPEMVGLQRPRLVVVRSGVRCGKSLIAAIAQVLGALTCQMRREPAPGEVPDRDGLCGVRKGELVRIPIVAPRLTLTRQTFRHLVSAVAGSALRATLADEPLTESVRLKRDDGYVVQVELVAASGAGANLRSTWVAGAIFDEADFHGEEGAVVNLDDNLAAVRTRLLPGAQVWVPSSPWVEGSEFDQLFKAAWGRPGSVLAFYASSRDMNPSLSLQDERDMRAADPARASREYDGLPSALRSTAFLPAEAIEAAIDRTRVGPVPPARWPVIAAGVDLGFRKNSSALAIAALVGERVRVVYHEERIPERGRALSPAEVVASFARTCASYGCASMRGDRYSLDATLDELRRLGRIRFQDGIPREVQYRTFDPTRQAQVELYTAFRRLLCEGKVELPNDPRLLGQLRAVTTRLVPGGGVVVDVPHDGAAHGDLAMAVVLAVAELEPHAFGATSLRLPAPRAADPDRVPIGY